MFDRSGKDKLAPDENFPKCQGTQIDSQKIERKIESSGTTGLLSGFQNFGRLPK